MTETTYAKAGETPGYQWLEVVDMQTGRVVNEVVEVNTREGWLVRYRTDESGHLLLDGSEVITERLEGRFQLKALRH